MFQGANLRRDRQSVSLIRGQEEEPPAPCPARRMASGYDTPPGGQSSWVDLGGNSTPPHHAGHSTPPHHPGHSTPPVPPSPGRATPVPLVQDQDYVRMLREAQKEFSARSSARVSPINSAMMSVSSTCKNTPSSSPKSPPNSPNVELCDFREFKEQLKLQGVFINREPEPRTEGSSGLTDWRSRPNSVPPRSWAPPQRKGREEGEERRREDSRLLYTLIASNVLSLGLGVAVGYWLYRRSAAAALSSF